jgi:cytochrome c-type biogenesis protein CcsB
MTAITLRHSPLVRFVMAFIACCASLCALPALAQTAPEGNAHPPTQALSEAGTDLKSPFGQHNTDPARAATVVRKAAFAREVDLRALRDVAVFHNGRVKVLETLADETVRRMTGKSRYVDYIKTPREGAADHVEEAPFSPLFTMLDVQIDPAFYLDKPLIGVEYLPMRRAYVELAFPDDEATQKRWLKLGRVTPEMVDRFTTRIGNSFGAQEPFAVSISRIDGAVRLFMFGSANWEVVPPASTDLPWAHLSTLPESHPARVAAAELGSAWRELDAPAVSAASARLAQALEAINPDAYASSRRSLELFYNRSNAFEWGTWFYLLSFVAALLSMGTGRAWLSRASMILLMAGLAMHATGFVVRCLVAERFAIQNQFESMTGVSLFGVIVGAAMMALRRQQLFGAAAAAVGFMVLLAATQAGIPGQTIEREAAILNTSVLLKYHVTTVLVSYGLIALGFIISLFYLGVYYFANTKKQGVDSRALSGTEPATSAGGGGAVSLAGAALGESESAPSAKVLGELDTAQIIVLQLAFWTLGVGILLGAWWADHSWGRWWAFDPKETWALITWIVYLIVIHVRIAAPARKGFTTAWLSVVGFFIMLWTYFGVNLLLPGLHAYA